VRGFGTGRCTSAAKTWSMPADSSIRLSESVIEGLGHWTDSHGRGEREAQHGVAAQKGANIFMADGRIRGLGGILKGIYYRELTEIELERNGRRV
jgi:hypothetical protein